MAASAGACARPPPVTVGGVGQRSGGAQACGHGADRPGERGGAAGSKIRGRLADQAWLAGGGGCSCRRHRLHCCSLLQRGELRTNLADLAVMASCFLAQSAILHAFLRESRLQVGKMSLMARERPRLRLCIAVLLLQSAGEGGKLLARLRRYRQRMGLAPGDQGQAEQGERGQEAGHQLLAMTQLLQATFQSRAEVVQAGAKALEIDADLLILEGECQQGGLLGVGEFLLCRQGDVQQPESLPEVGGQDILLLTLAVHDAV